jgi:hypothetical protein
MNNLSRINGQTESYKKKWRYAAFYDTLRAFWTGWRFDAQAAFYALVKRRQR